jgi:hypothetical protein
MGTDQDRRLSKLQRGINGFAQIQRGSTLGADSPQPRYIESDSIREVDTTFQDDVRVLGIIC